MAFFEYKVRTKEGKVVKGNVEGDSKEKVAEHLHAQGMIIISVSKKSGGKRKKKKSSGKVKPDEIVVFSRQLTTLVESGIPLVQGLQILQEQIKSPYFKSVISDLYNQIKEGSSFHAALEKYPNVFSEFYINMVKAGEASGELSAILDRISKYIEDSLALQRKVRSSLAYPTIVIGMALLITAFLILKVIPTFKDIFATLNTTLPLPTQILIGISDFCRNWFWFGIGGLVGFVIAAKKLISTPVGRRKFDMMMLKLPIIGELIQKIAVAKFCRTFSTLISSGVSILNVLSIVGKTAGNKVLEDAVFAARKFIQQGEQISEPLARSGVFPPMVVRMIGVGERTGKLEAMLTKISQFYEEEVDAAVSGLTSMIEPLIIGFLGIVIGGIVISLFLPIIQITKVIGQ